MSLLAMASRCFHALASPVREPGSVDLGYSPAPRVSSSLSFSGHVPQLEQKLQFRARASSVMTAETTKQENMLDIDPAFYEMGYMRHLRAYGVDFKEGIDGVGVYASKDVLVLKKPRIIMEIPLELMISISKDPPWIFHPNFVPLGHPVFDIINSTDPEVDWDIRLGCLLLFAMDTKDHFWQLYSDFLPDATECTSLLLANENELAELQDNELAAIIRQHQKRVENFWEKNMTGNAPLKIKRLAPTIDHFKWAVAIAQTRHIRMNMTVGARPQVSDMFIPYMDMMNHSAQPTCSYRWRWKDRMVEVMLNRGQTIKAGAEMTLNYLERASNEKFVQFFGFASPGNEWDKLKFSGDTRIHRDSFLSAFQISGLPDEYYFNDHSVKSGDAFLDGSVISIARNLPFWHEDDLPFLPSAEKASVDKLQEECSAMLEAYPTTLESDLDLLASNPKRRTRRWKVAVEYRSQKKALIQKTKSALELYLKRLLY